MRGARTAVVLATAVTTMASGGTAAGAAPTLGPATAVVQPGCTYDEDFAQAWVGPKGVTHGFFSVAGNESFGCGSPQTWRFDGSGTRWTSASAPMAAHVMAIAGDATGVYLLYASTDGIHLRKRSAGGAVADRTLSSRGLGTHIVPTGDVIARHGSWWAVWTENTMPSGLGQTDLFQARTIGGTGARTRLTSTPAWSEADPRLAARPGGDAVAVWDRAAESGAGTMQVVLARSDGGAWRAHRFSLTGTMNWLPDVAVTAASTAVTWTRDGSVRYADDTGGTWHRRGLGAGDGPRIARSAGRVFVAYDAHGLVRLAERDRAGAWSTVTVTPLRGRFVHAVTAFDGVATVFYSDGRRLLARVAT